MTRKKINEREISEKELLKEILNQLEIMNRFHASKLLEQELYDNKTKKLYELTDGKKLTKEISNLVGISDGKISKLWNRWFSLGLIKKDGRKYKKVF